MADAPDRPILIAGAGIGGLTAAIALARAGFPVALIEQATRFAEIGAGLQLSPNASRILIDLGLGAALARRATSPDALIVHRLDGQRELARMPMSGARDAFGAPYWATLRADLQTALIDAARADRSVSFLVGRKVERVNASGAGVSIEVRTAAGASETIEGRALIGADGLWSRVREFVAPKAETRFASYEAWRALIPADATPEAARRPTTHLWIGAEAHLVHYPVAGGRMINLVLVRPAEKPRDETRREEWGDDGDRAALDNLARLMGAPARDLIAAAPHWQVWSLYDRPPLPLWTRGSVALMGDAAHPVLPFLAQGAALAIEDAAVLAQEAARLPDNLPRAFARYASRRMDRAARVQKASRAARSMRRDA